MKITTRKAKKSDVESIFRFMCSLSGTQFKRKKFRDIFLKNINDKNIHYYVSEYQSRVIGFVSIYIHALLHHCSEVAEIAELYVEKEFRNNKVGARLIKLAIERAVKNRCSLIEVTTNRKRKNAHRFYEKEKFTKSHYKFTFKLC